MTTERRKRPETPYSMMAEKLDALREASLLLERNQARILSLEASLARMEGQSENMRQLTKQKAESWKKDLQAAREYQRTRSEYLTKMQQKLEAAIEKIPNEDYKTILKAKYFDGKTDAEVADMQGLEYMKSKRKIRAAITKLAECGGL